MPQSHNTKVTSTKAKISDINSHIIDYKKNYQCVFTYKSLKLSHGNTNSKASNSGSGKS